MSTLATIIETAFDDRANFTAQTVSPEIRAAVDEVIEALDNGSLRVAQKKLMASGLFTNGSKKKRYYCPLKSMTTNP